MPIPWMTVTRIAAWAVLLAVAAATIGPISQRPHTLISVNLDRLIAWLCVGAIFAKAYTRRGGLLLVLLLSAAGLLELAQIESLHRHGRLSDFLVKAAGSLVGIGSVRAVQYLRSLN